MGTIYAIANQKGGVGKTTTAVNTAACVAAEGDQVLLVDLDQQCNATVALDRPKDSEPNVYECLSGDLTLDQAARPTAIDGLGPVRDRFSLTLLDCPPSLGPVTVNALVAADRVIVPVQTEYFALEGLAGLLDTLALVQRELNPRLTVAGMLLTMHDARTKLAQDVEAEVRRHFPSLVFDTVIPRNVRLGEAPSFGVPVIHHDPHCAGSDAYFELAKEVAARG